MKILDMKNDDERDQSWRKELGLDGWWKKKKPKPVEKYTGNSRQELGLDDAPKSVNLKKRKLEKCTSCGKKISVLAETCPSCGAPNESKEIVEKNSNAAVWSMLTIVFILFLMFHCELGIPLGWFGECTYTKPFWE